MPKMTNQDLISIVSEAESDAAIYNGEVMRDNEKFLEAYYADACGDFAAEDEGSSIVSTDVQDVVDSDMAALARIFLGSGDIIQFEPRTNSEVEIAEAQEKTEYVNWLIRKQPTSYKTIHDWLKDAEINKTGGVVKYFIEECQETEEVKYTGVDAQELAAIVESLQDPKVTKVDVVDQEENEDGTFDINFRVTKEDKKLKIINIPPESFLISKNASSKHDAEIVGDRVRKTRGQLLSEGFKRSLIDMLPTVSEEDDRTSPLTATRNKDEGGVDQESDIREWASEFVEISDLYVKIDYDGDGIAERRHIMLSGNNILINEAFNHVPYAINTAILMPHKVIGRSRAEVTYEYQRQNTSLKRGIFNNIYMVNNPRNIVHPDVDLDDMLANRINGIVRMEEDTQVLPGNAVFPLTVPYIGDKALQVAQFTNQNRAQTTGVMLANQGLDADKISQETATRFEGIQDHGDAKLEHVARNFAETGFRDLYEGVAWMVSRFQDTTTEFRVLGKALTVNPTSWKYEHFVECKIGLGAGNNEKLVEARQGIYAIQQQLMAQGSSIVDSVGVYNNLQGITDGLGFNRSERLFNNPEEPSELLQRQNELLNMMVLQLQEQVAQLQNPLAEAEAIKREGDIAIAQGKLALDAAKLQEQQRQFDVSTAQDANQHNQNTAVKLTELELNSGRDVPGSAV